MDAALSRIARDIDVDSSVSVSVQLRGALEYGIATGDIPPGSRLPSVRRMAAQLGLSPVTVSGVYSALQERGHIEGRIGSGTYVAERAAPAPGDAGRLAAFERKITELVDFGQTMGLSARDVAFRVSLAVPAAQQPVRLLMLGTFRDATIAYAEDLAPYLRPGDTVTAASLEEVTAQTPADYDLVCCPRTIMTRAGELFPDLPVIGVTLIPNEATRISLATIAPDATVAVVSFFDDFLTVMKGGINRFAPHVSRITAVPRGFPALAEVLAQADVLIHATGAGYLREALRPDQTAIEYRHTPDSNAVRTELLPAIEAARLSATRKDRPDEDKSKQLVRDRRVAENR